MDENQVEIDAGGDAGVAPAGSFIGAVSEASTERDQESEDAGNIATFPVATGQGSNLPTESREDVRSFGGGDTDGLTLNGDDLPASLPIFLRALHAFRSPPSSASGRPPGAGSRVPRYTYQEEVSRLVASRLTMAFCNNDVSLVRSVFPEFFQPERTNVVHALKLSEMENVESHGGAVCAHVFRKGEGVYRCRNCALDETVVMCTKCYHASNHEGHDVLFTINVAAGGCCDCGDPEAWIIPLTCQYHSSSDNYLYAGEWRGKSYATLSKRAVEHWRSTLRDIFEYVLDTLANSPTFRGESGVSIESIKERTQRITRDYGEEMEPHDYVLVLWNDETHTFAEVIERVGLVTGQSYTECNAVAHEVDRLGRAVISVSSDIDELEAGRWKLGNIGLSASVMSMREAFREDLASFCLLWLHELAIGRRGTGHFPGEAGIMLRPVFRELVCEVLCEEWDAVGNNGSAKRRPSAALVDNGDVDKVRILSDSRGLTSLDYRETSLAFPEEESAIRRSSAAQVSAAKYDVCSMPGVVTGAGNEKVEFSQVDVDNGAGDTTISPDMSVPSSFTIGDYILAAFESSRHPAFADLKNWVTGPFSGEGEVIGVSTATEDDETMATASPIVEEPLSATNSAGSLAPSPAVRRVSQSGYAKLYEDFHASLRLDWLLLFDIKGWKALRLTLKQLYIATMLTNSEYKRALGIRFARNYVRLVEFCMIEDKEYDLPIINLSVQLFTVPTISLLLTTKYDFVSALCAIIRAFLTSDSRVTALPLPGATSRPRSKRPLECSSSQFYNRRVSLQLFHDLRYVFSNPAVRHYVVFLPERLSAFLDLLAHFQGMSPIKRRTQTHVEYENDWWINAFHVTIHLGRLTRIFAKSYTSMPSTPRVLITVIMTTLRRINEWIDPDETAEQFVARLSSNEGPTSPQNRSPWSSPSLSLPPHMHYVADIHKRRIPVVRYLLTSQTVSVHNPLHWFLSCLMSEVGWLTDDALGGPKGSLRRIIYDWKKTARDLNYTFDDIPACLPFDLDYSVPPFRAIADLLHIFDYPIRTLAWISQVRTGIWIRNGLVATGQARHYRDVSLRGNAYDQDVFLVQLAFALFNPEQMLMTLIDRFDLLNMFSDKLVPHKIYDERQCVGLTEELLSLLIAILSERIRLSGGSPEEEIRRSLIHFLAVRPLAYSELQAKLPETLAEHESLKNVLSEVSDFQRPFGMNGGGTYKLKEQFLKDVSPYFMGYTKAQRDDVEVVLKERHKRQQEEASRKGAMPPKQSLPILAPMPDGPFKALCQVLHTRLFVQCVFYILWRTMQFTKKRSEMLIDQSLHLTLMALAEPDIEQLASDPPSFPSFVRFAYAEHHPVLINECEREQWTLLKLFMKLAASADFKPYHDRLRHIIFQIEDKGNEGCQKLVREWRQTNLEADTEKAMNREREMKKEAAKARQAKLMAEFAAAQQSFQENNADFYREIAEELGESGELLPKDDDDTAAREQELFSRPFPRGTCIFCQEDATVLKDKPYGILAFVQGSKVYRVVDAAVPTLFADALACPESLDRRHDRSLDVRAPGSVPHSGWPSAYGVPGAFMSSCGHLMHVSCFREYKEAIRAKHRLQQQRSYPEDTSKGEFLCPLCKAMGNVLLPVAWLEKKEGPIDKHPDAVGAIDVTRSSIESLDTWIDKNVLADPTESVTSMDSRGTYENESASEIAADSDMPMEPGDDRKRRRSSTARLREVLSSMVQDWFGVRGSFSNRSPTRERLSEEGKSQWGIFRQSYDDLMGVAEAALGRKDANDIDGSRLCNALSYTISCVEAAERGEESKDEASISSTGCDAFPTANPSDASAQVSGTWLARLPRKTLNLLRVVCETLFTYTTLVGSDDPAAYQGIKASRISRLRLLCYSSGVPQGSASLEASEAEAFLVAAKPWVHRDAFSLLVKMCICDVIPGKWPAHHFVLIAFVSDIVKTILAVAESTIASNTAENGKPVLATFAHPRVKVVSTTKHDPQSAEVAALAHFAQWVLESAGYSPPVVAKFLAEQVLPRELFKLVQAYSTPFLRKCTALLYARFGVTYASRQTINEAPEMERLMAHLAIPPFHVLLRLGDDGARESPRMFSGLRKLVCSWLRHHVGHRSASGTAPPRRLKLAYPDIYRLVKLPDRFDKLYEASLLIKCPTCRTVPQNPAFCLMCGRILCTQSRCCMDGENEECYTHKKACGNEVGMFFLVRKCVIFLMHNTNGLLTTAPYLDENGEPDIELKRGKPQYLVSERYDGIRKLWINHEIAHTIARRMEIDAGGWQIM